LCVLEVSLLNVHFDEDETKAAEVKNMEERSPAAGNRVPDHAISAQVVFGGGRDSLVLERVKQQKKPKQEYIRR
jgi:hypothetical protein